MIVNPDYQARNIAKDFYAAVQKGDCARVRALYDAAFFSGIPAETHGYYLQEALKNKDRDMMRLLITWGATVTPGEIAELPQQERQASLVLLRRCGLNIRVQDVLKKIPAQIGDTMADGSVYLGRHEGQYWYVAAEDGKMPDGSRLELDFAAASRYAKETKVHGHNDWQLPPWYILKVMHTFRAAGAFVDTYLEEWNSRYYLSSERDARQPQLVKQLAFLRNQDGCYHELNKGLVRCIRAGKAPGGGR